MITCGCFRLQQQSEARRRVQRPEREERGAERAWACLDSATHAQPPLRTLDVMAARDRCQHGWELGCGCSMRAQCADLLQVTARFSLYVQTKSYRFDTAQPLPPPPYNTHRPQQGQQGRAGADVRGKVWATDPAVNSIRGCNRRTGQQGHGGIFNTLQISTSVISTPFFSPLTSPNLL